MKFISLIFYWVLAFTVFMCGGATAQVGQRDVDVFLNDSAVRTGHAGISIYEPATGKYLYNYNAEKNFLPSSNVKLFTLYAGMKYLGDSLPGIRYTEDDSSIYIIPTGDPTLLHPDFKSQPVYQFLISTRKKILYNFYPLISTSYAAGWAWDDYMEEFMAERSALPVYGNVKTFYFKRRGQKSIPGEILEDSVNAHYWNNKMYHGHEHAGRSFYSNRFYIVVGKGLKEIDTVKVPFITSLPLSFKLLADTLKKNIDDDRYKHKQDKQIKKILYSHPVDSLFLPMMFYSDNFFAEQTLLMVSNERLGFMSDEQIIDTLLKTDLKDIPNKPRWVDGSGLSRYNLFSPKAFVYILDKLQKEFGIERMKRILPTAGQGTLTNYYDGAAEKIHAKTGSMSNNVALSGYLYTRKNRMLLFSILVNSYTGSGREGRRAIEKFLERIRETN